jgi:hypothetical protein
MSRPPRRNSALVLVVLAIAGVVAAITPVERASSVCSFCGARSVTASFGPVPFESVVTEAAQREQVDAQFGPHEHRWLLLQVTEHRLLGEPRRRPGVPDPSACIRLVTSQMGEPAKRDRALQLHRELQRASTEAELVDIADRATRLDRSGFESR